MKVRNQIELIGILIQLVAVGPTIPIFPLAALMGIGQIYLLIIGDIFELNKIIWLGFGWLGLIGLYGSIIIPIEILKSNKWFRRIILYFLVLGLARLSMVKCLF